MFFFSFLPFFLFSLFTLFHFFIFPFFLIFFHGRRDSATGHRRDFTRSFLCSRHLSAVSFFTNGAEGKGAGSASLQALVQRHVVGPDSVKFSSSRVASELMYS